MLLVIALVAVGVLSVSLGAAVWAWAAVRMGEVSSRWLIRAIMLTSSFAFAAVV